MAGAYLRRRGQDFIFVRGGEYVPRQRLTLAHELGHLRLGHEAVVDSDAEVDGRSRDPQEEQAFFFAGILLAPEAALLDWLAAEDEPELDMSVLASLAGWLGISVPALLVRLEQESILEKRSQINRLWREVDRGLHKGAEQALGLGVGADELARVAGERKPRLPSRLRDNALGAYAAGLIDLDRLAQALRRPRPEVEALVRELGLAPPEPEPDW